MHRSSASTGGCPSTRPDSGSDRGLAVQGNLDPALCLTPWAVVESETREVLDAAGTRPGHIFNLGHGVLPETDPAVLEQVVDLVHAEGRAGRRGRRLRDPIGAPMSGPGSSPVGVLVMAHGTPSTPEEIEPLLHRDPPWTAAHRRAAGRARRRGTGPSAGTSPLTERTGRPGRRGWPPRSSRRHPAGSVVAFGAKHAAPTIEDAVAALAAAGVGGIVGLVLTPHQSTLGSGEYFRRAAAAPPRTLRRRSTSSRSPPGTGPTGSPRSSPHAPRPRSTHSTRRRRSRTVVFFTAHSLPLRSLAEGDPYPGAGRPSPPPTSPTCSASDDRSRRRPGEWPGRARVARPTRGSDPTCSARSGGWPPTGATAVVVCPVGFVSDHLEVLYDLDIEAGRRGRGRRHGLRPDRVAQRRSPRSSPLLAGVVAGRRRATDRSERTAGPPDRPSWPSVGGGIAGLVGRVGAGAGAGPDGGAVRGRAARRRRHGSAASSAPTEFAGRTVDLAADAFLARRPEATELCDELGLTDELVPVGAAGASIWARGRLRPMPEGSNLGVPTQWWPLVRSGILEPDGVAAGGDATWCTPHRGARGITGDRAVGEIVGARLGRPVVDRLVDPLVGGIHAGDVDELSAAATFPLLLAADQQPGSLMRRLASRRPTARPRPTRRRPMGPRRLSGRWRESTASLAGASRSTRSAGGG